MFSFLIFHSLVTFDTARGREVAGMFSLIYCRTLGVCVKWLIIC